MMGHERGNMLWQIFYQFEPPVRNPIARWVQEMAQGMVLMKEDARNGSKLFVHCQAVQLPASKEGYDRYCCYVSGTVGHMMTELVVNHYGINGVGAANLETNSEACGRALQKTNIVKDFAKDLARGVSYLPDTWMQEVNYTPLSLKGAPAYWKKKVLADVLDELDDSIHYVDEVPLDAVGYRQACLLMMLPACQTILLAAQNLHLLFTTDHQVKIPRLTMVKCVSQATPNGQHRNRPWSGCWKPLTISI